MIVSQKKKRKEKKPTTLLPVKPLHHLFPKNIFVVQRFLSKEKKTYEDWGYIFGVVDRSDLFFVKMNVTVRSPTLSETETSKAPVKARTVTFVTHSFTKTVWE